MSSKNKKYNNVSTNEATGGRSDEWSYAEGKSSTGSDVSSVYSTYNPEFKNYIDEDGNLFYIKCYPIELSKKHPNVPTSILKTNDNLFRNEYKRMSLRQNKTILSKFAAKKVKKSQYDLKIIDKHKYEHADGVLKEFRISIKPGKLRKFSKQIHHRDDNLFEMIFDATIMLAPDGKRFLINKINEGSVFERDLLVGDFIKSIDGELITTENLDGLLRKIQNQKAMKIVAQECYKDEFESTQDEIKIIKISDVIENKKKLFNLENEFHDLIFSFNMIVKNEAAAEDADDLVTLFSYPPKEKNFLHKLKGSFLTIASILKTSLDAVPVITSINVRDNTFFVSYTIRNNEKEFIFLGFNSQFTNLLDAKLITNNMIKLLDYTYPDFGKNRNFEQLQQLCEMTKVQLLKMHSSSGVVNFEQLFSFSTYVPLPKEIVLRINDSLSELEAMDYRNWNEDLMELFGKFNVVGTCLFYKTSLICSHFNSKDSENIEVFLRAYCLKLLYKHCLIREIVIWQRVYPKDYQSFNIDNDSSQNKVFLLVVAHGSLLMCVILEENGYNINQEVESLSANYLIYYLEEMEDILDHLKIVGIENLTRIWINAQKRPQCRNLLESAVHSLSALEQSESSSMKTLKEDHDDNDGNDSDFDSQLDSQKSSSGFDMNDFSDAIYKDFTDIIPQTLTFGPENVLYHFTQIDPVEGIILTSINEQNPNGKNEILVDLFRRSCIKIHSLLQSSIKFSNILSKETNKIVNSRSVVAIKEHGILIQLKQESGENVEFWVVGRLFGIRELYVCYDSRIPQNMVELAFRIGLNCVG
ncbi:unnamed protein product [Diamesa hyperborea]